MLSARVACSQPKHALVSFAYCAKNAKWSEHVPAGSPAEKRSEHIAEWSTNASSSLVVWLDLKLRTCGSARVQETGSMQKPPLIIG